MVGGTFLLTCHDALSKYMTATYHVGEIMAYRSLVPLVVMAGILLMSGGTGALVPKSPGANLTRAVLATLTSFFVVASYASMPLADALAIVFASPIFLTALAVPMLGERVSWQRWAAVLAGFGGVLLIVNPTGSVLQVGALFAIAAALASAMRDIVTRKMGTLDSATNVLFITTLVSAVAGLASFSVEFNGWPTLRDWVLFACAGALVSAAHWLLIRSFQLAEASIVAPLRYVAIVYGAGFGFVVFDEVPGPAQVSGAVVVVLAGLFIMRSRH